MATDEKDKTDKAGKWVMKGRVDKITSRLVSIEGILDLLVNHKAVKKLDVIDKRVDNISKRLAVMIDKNCLVSEMTRYNPSLVFPIIKLFEREDTFWRERASWTLKQWELDLNDGQLRSVK